MNEDSYIKQFQSIQINNSESTKDDRDKKTMRGKHIKCMKYTVFLKKTEQVQREK